MNVPLKGEIEAPAPHLSDVGLGKLRPCLASCDIPSGITLKNEAPYEARTL